MGDAPTVTPTTIVSVTETVAPSASSTPEARVTVPVHFSCHGPQCPGSQHLAPASGLDKRYQSPGADLDLPDFEYDDLKLSGLIDDLHDAVNEHENLLGHKEQAVKGLNSWLAKLKTFTLDWTIAQENLESAKRKFLGLEYDAPGLGAEDVAIYLSILIP